MLSIVLTVFNGADLLGRQLEAVALQSYPHPWELVVVDNASTDNSAAIAQSFADRIPNLRVVPEHRLRGRPFALNTGVLAARGDRILLLDHDDEVGEGWLPAMAAALEQHAFVAARMEHTKLNPPHLQWKQQVTDLPRLWFPPYLPNAAGATLGFRRTVFDQLGGFDTTLRVLQDTDFCIRAQLEGIGIELVLDAPLHYRRRSGLAAHYAQSRGYARECAILARNYAHYARPTDRLWPWYRAFVREWIRLAREASHPRNESEQYVFAWRLGRQVGRLQGVLFDHGIPV
jgi:glycosyltransferase involved in cell wall biosynthesis